MATGELTPLVGVSKNAKPHQSAWPATALVIGFSTLPVLHSFFAPFRTLDEAVLLVYPEQMMSGRIPHRDFFTVYGPGGFAALASVFFLTGPSVLAERAVGLLYHVALATGLMRLTRPFGLLASCSAGITSALVLLPVDLGAYAWFGGLACAVWSLALLARPGGRATTFLAGVLGGMVMAWRIEMLVLLLSAGPLIWKGRLKTTYLAGIVVGLLPMIAFLTFFGEAVLRNFFLSRLALNAQLEPESVPIRVWSGLAVLLLITGTLLVTAIRRATRRPLSLSFAILAILLLPQALQRIDVHHTVYVMCVVGPLGVATLVHLSLKDDRSGSVVTEVVVSRRVMAAAFVMLAITASLSTVAFFRGNVSELTRNGRTTLLSTATQPIVAAELRLITDALPPGSSIFIGASDMSVPTLTHIEFYHLLPDYEANAYFLELPPGVAEKAGSPLVGDIMNAEGLILTDIRPGQSQALFPFMGEGVDDANRAVTDNFCAVGTVARTTVYQRCKPTIRTPSGDR